MDNIETIDLFIKNFIQKDKRSRSEFQLKNIKKRSGFVDRLNHKWADLLDMRYLSQIVDAENFIKNVQLELNIKNNDSCYIISNFNDLDNKVMDFKIAFESVYGRGFGSILVNLNGTKLYLETEIGLGKQYRFIGKR
jgi:hypothetical protein